MAASRVSSPDCLAVERHALKRLESGDAEHRVIEIPASGSILEPTSGIPLVFEETADEIGRFTQETRGEAGNLKHLDAQTHGVRRFPRHSALVRGSPRDGLAFEHRPNGHQARARQRLSG
jgi:hypothetical protein